jgi:hypothetical protein
VAASFVLRNDQSDSGVGSSPERFLAGRLNAEDLNLYSEKRLPSYGDYSKGAARK